MIHNGPLSPAFFRAHASAFAVPLLCTLAAQYLQDMAAAGHDASDLSRQGLLSPFFLVSFLKLLSLTTLIVHAARPRPEGPHPADRAGTARADGHLAFILAANVTLGCLAIAAVRLVRSEALPPLLGTRLAPAAATAALLCVLVAALAPLNRRVFHDISLAIGSQAHLDLAPAELSRANRRFLTLLVRPLLTYVAPPLALHLLLARLILSPTGWPAPLALTDCALVGAIGVLTGRAIARAHHETLASA